MGKRFRAGGRDCGCGIGIGCGCGCCGSGPFARFSLLLFNTIFLISGLTFVGLGIWVKVEKNFVSLQDLVDHGAGDSTLSNAGSVLIGFGFFVAVVSALGCLAVCCSKKKAIISVYTLLLIVIFCCGIAASIIYGVFRGKIDDTLSNALTKTVKSYKLESEYTKDWDYVQTWMKCCGSTGPKDYKDVKFQEPSKYVPETCCVLTNNDPEQPKPRNGTQCQMDAQQYLEGNITTSQVLQTIGCYQSLEDIIDAHLAVIIGVGVAIATLQLLGICLAIGICLETSDR
ncbi:tetraspanin-6-like isoform X1 [Mercenaria mercenaria]|uniref:tetraspanin-6-like isoform X1 n=1 Tax=Mercenaria mercenaria TaxID=6596 RepID=UPI00234E85B5|nr:tetraspanin-6-like isoform X1 [Mercenaria mercenaria]